MTHLKKSRFLSLFLVLALVLTMLPTAAFAAELPEEEHIHTEECVHEQVESVLDEEAEPEPVEERALASEPESEQAEVTSDEQDLYSGTIGDSSVQWSFDPSSVRLMISGSGGCERFSSADDQPWAHLRTQIAEVWFNDMDSLQIYDLAYWFEGCTALTSAEIPYTTSLVGTNAFANCPSLTDVLFSYYDEDTFSFIVDAFAVAQPTETTVILIADQQSAAHKIISYDWTANNRTIKVRDAYSTEFLADCALGACTCSSCGWKYVYYQSSASKHDKYVACTGCSATFWLSSESHSFGSNGYCSSCGYYNSSYDTSICYHTSTYYTWSGCTYYEYCRNCGEYLGSGVSHGTYSYGAWTYYSTTQHRRLYSCNDCGSGSYSYGNHSTSTSYGQYNSTQHSVRAYCATCSSYIGSTSYANHSFTYGTWSSYDDSQHRRTATCSDCGYSTYEYASHSLSYGSWSSASDTQHSRTASCSCGYSTTETANHSFTYGAWASVSDAEHSRSKTCSCGYSSTETGSHTDTDGDGSCDDCGYLMSRFSVTVPATLNLTVAKNGTVYAATSAQIVNNSTGAVCVTGVKLTAENGWKLVPYATNMADVKVDSKQIGFSLNGAESDGSATLPMSGSWFIAKDAALSLDYDAVVSATSNPINEQVLTVVLVLDWAA